MNKIMPKPQKRSLVVAMQIAGMALASLSTPGFAQLLDHGPADPVLIWPQWYRDNNGTAVGLCKSQVPSPNAAAGAAPMCFPLPSDPAAFAGNIGPEIFYNMVEYKQKPGAATGFNFRYMGALEASYVPGPNPVHGQETVFARIRVAMNFNDPSFSGDYTVIHPFGVEHFPNVQATTNSGTVQGAQAALFATFDVPLGVPNDFNAALGGPLGPFIEWDTLNPGETLTVGGLQFLGDPNYPHTFTGSPFIDKDGNPQNYIKVIGPAGANLDGNGGNVLLITEANVLGQVWTAPIASNLVVEQAVKARSTATGKNSVDVWATSSPGHKLVLTGVGMPSMEMYEDTTAKGHYHGHIEYPVAQETPSFVTVTDNTSVPIISGDHQLVDGVEVSKATYDTSTGDVYIMAHSTDEINPLPSLLVENIPGVPSAPGVTPFVSSQMTSAACANPPFQGQATLVDKCFHYTLPLNQSVAIEPPKFINVRSSSGGSHDDQLVMLTGNPQNISPAPLQSDVSLSVNSSGTTVLDLPTNSLIVTQPGQGTIALVAGQYRFTANPGTAVGNDSFKFVVQDPVTKAVSAQSTANLSIVFTAAAPTAASDQFAALNKTAKVLNVLANDKPATADAANAINPASVVITKAPSRGVAAVNSNGTISYTPNTAGVIDSFSYTVKNTVGQTSAPATVEVTNFSGTESIAYKKGPQYIGGKWTITATTSWFGPSLTQTTMSCYLTANNGVTLATPILIGSATVDATGTAQMAGQASPIAGPNSGTANCITSNGGSRAAAVAFK